MGQIETTGRQWFAVRMKQPQNRGRRTTVIGGEFEAYTGAGGVRKKRRIHGTGTRVFVPEHLLRRAGFDVFLPVRKEWRRANRFSNEKTLVAYPLLNDWLFVGWPEGESRWHQLMDLDVVAGVLSTGGRPIIIPEAKVKRLMRRWGGGKLSPDLYRYMKTGAEYGVGDRVRVADGPFQDFEAKVLEINGRDVKAVVDIFGRETPFDIAADLLEATS